MEETPQDDAFEAAVQAELAKKMTASSPDAATEEMHIEEHRDETIMDNAYEKQEELPEHQNKFGSDFYMGKPEADPANPIMHFATQEEIEASRPHR